METARPPETWIVAGGREPHIDSGLQAFSGCIRNLFLVCMDPMAAGSHYIFGLHRFCGCGSQSSLGLQRHDGFAHMWEGLQMHCGCVRTGPMGCRYLMAAVRTFSMGGMCFVAGRMFLRTWSMGCSLDMADRRSFLGCPGIVAAGSHVIDGLQLFCGCIRIFILGCIFVVAASSHGYCGLQSGYGWRFARRLGVTDCIWLFRTISMGCSSFMAAVAQFLGVASKLWLTALVLGDASNQWLPRSHEFRGGAGDTGLCALSYWSAVVAWLPFASFGGLLIYIGGVARIFWAALLQWLPGSHE